MNSGPMNSGPMSPGPMARGPRHPTRWVGVLAAAGLAVVLSGCSPTVTLPSAPQETSRACAAIIVRLPPTLGSESLLQTDQQGTAAWGGEPAVTLRCGVPPPGPTTDNCFQSGGVDWVDRLVAGTQTYVVTTFGRTPATQLTIDTRQIGSSELLPALADPVQEAFLQRHGKSSKGWVFNKGLRYREAMIEVNETVAVLGQGIREPDTAMAPSGDYRSGPPTLLRLTSSPKFPLVISDDTSTTQ